MSIWFNQSNKINTYLDKKHPFGLGTLVLLADLVSTNGPSSSSNRKKLPISYGFTLLEILIALSIFAILATITSSSLYYAFTTRTKVNLQADRLNELQLAVSIIQQDVSQIINRATRGNEMRLFPVILGQPEYMEFTRDGIANPKGIDKRSTLKRVAFTCQEGALIRRTWQTLDPINRDKYQNRVLIRNLKECHFNYLNHTLQSLSEWREQGFTKGQKAEVFPTALQINLTLKDWGKLNLLFIIPEALYVSS